MLPRLYKYLLCVGMFSLAITRIATAQDPLTAIRPYDGIQAGIDAYRLAEEKRQGAVNQQIVVNDQLRYWNGYPTSRGENIYSDTIYYGYMSPAALAAYGYGGYGPWTGFQPGPWMGSGLWGTPYSYQPARQPIGQTQIQISPSRWESHPVYDPPLTMHNAQPPVASPLLDRTPYAIPPAATTSEPPTSAPPVSIEPVSPPKSLLKSIESIPPPPPPPTAPAATSGPREY